MHRGRQGVEICREGPVSHWLGTHLDVCVRRPRAGKELLETGETGSGAHTGQVMFWGSARQHEISQYMGDCVVSTEGYCHRSGAELAPD